MAHVAKTARSFAILALSSCYSTGNGPDPPANSLYFPVAVVVSPGGNALYVANSDFDLQFNAGTVQVYDLAAIRNFLVPLWSPAPGQTQADACAALGLGTNATPTLYPGPCGPFNLSPTVKGSAKIGAFATDALFVCPPSPNPLLDGADCTNAGRVDLSAPGFATGDKARLFVPVRGDPSLTFLEVDDDRPTLANPQAPGVQSFLLECGQETNSGRCSDSNRAGINANDSPRALTIPAEPFGVAVTDHASAIVVTHQTSGAGALSLFTAVSNTNESVLGATPTLQFVFGGLPAASTGISSIPIPLAVLQEGLPSGYHPGFVATFREAAEADVFRVFPDDGAAPPRPFLVRTAGDALTATPSGADSRGVAIDASRRTACVTGCTSTNDACVATCAAGDTSCTAACSSSEDTCLNACSQIPLPVYIANRSPAALLIGQVIAPDPTLSTEEVRIDNSVPLLQGPSRVVIGRIRNPAGQFETRVFVVCFDSREIFVYNPAAGRIDGTIPTGRGPHSLAMDPTAPIAYVAHFTDSYIGLIDLDASHVESFESIVATIGVPFPPAGSQ